MGTVATRFDVCRVSHGDRKSHANERIPFAIVVAPMLQKIPRRSAAIRLHAIGRTQLPGTVTSRQQRSAFTSVLWQTTGMYGRTEATG
jgi:hypothetical protein